MSKLRSYFNSGNPPLPTSIAGLKFWVDADDASTINAGSPVNNDPVSLWVDKSGTVNATQGTGTNQPLYKSSGFGANSKPYLDFDGVNDFMTLGTTISKLPQRTVFVVTEAEATTTNVIIGENDSAGQSITTGISIQLRTVASQFLQRSVSGDGVLARIVQSLESMFINTPYIIADYRATVQSITDLRSNGQDLTEVDFSGSSSTIAGTKFDLVIGRAGEFNGGYLNGKVAEIIVFDSYLSASDIFNMETYLNCKYNTF